jgi:Right handed beta helix region
MCYRRCACRGRAAVLALLIAGCNCCAAWASDSGRAWYVDCGNGSDTADGLSPKTAWKSLQAVSTRTFQPGDSISFRRGSVCSGLLSPKGSGAGSAPIRLGAWGVGPLPRIQALRDQKAALTLFNQEYWTIEHLDFSGGRPYGIFVSGDKGVLHGIHIRDVVVHNVTGEPRDKESGLLVIAAGAEQQHFDDVLIDGVTAYGTTQWTGMMVAGVTHGFPHESSRNTNVVIRNSIVHDVAGDGIVLFQVNNGLIENSVAWRTGMQETESIGTPNAIWTWMCRNCTVRHNEAFLTDSPGVDGGAFDIDYGNADNTVEENYAHDTQGYCVAVFGAGWATTNSVVRNNVCVANGLSPRLARRQGAVFLSTWDHGKIQGLDITGNRIFWNPPLAAAAIVNVADFVGTASFRNNTLRSTSPVMIRSNSSLVFDANSSEYCGRDGPGCAEPTAEKPPPDRKVHLLAFVSAAPEDSASRGQVTMLQSLHHQYPDLPIRIVVAGDEAKENLRSDWNTGGMQLSFDAGEARRALGVSRMPAVVVADASQDVLLRQDGLMPAGTLGLFLRKLLGVPKYAQMSPEQR